MYVLFVHIKELLTQSTVIYYIKYWYVSRMSSPMLSRMKTNVTCYLLKEKWTFLHQDCV